MNKNMNKEKIAVLFPGIGYTCDKPLLYYSAALAVQKGYTVVKVPYGGFPSMVKGDPVKMYQCFLSARDQAEEMLAGVEWENYEEILFFSKSVGTAAAMSYAADHELQVRHILYTPVAATFKFPAGEAVAFHGTKDSWAETEELVRLSREQGIPLHLVEGANHSLEQGDLKKDLKTLKDVMKTAAAFIG